MVFHVEPGIRVRRVLTGKSGLLVTRVPKYHIPLSKRLFDKAFASAALLFFAPFLGIIAVAVKLTEGGPVLFGHARVGLGGKRFRCLKFRTMCQDADQRLETLLKTDPRARAEWRANHKLAADPRVSRLGEILRKTSLDELPQFWNVLKGEMSIVGPRPVVLDEARFYGDHFQDYIAVLPGITGAWQVSGRNDTSYDERVALDVDYIHSQSFFGDIWIVVKTVAVVLTRRGAR